MAMLASVEFSTFTGLDHEESYVARVRSISPTTPTSNDSEPAKPASVTTESSAVSEPTQYSLMLGTVLEHKIPHEEVIAQGNYPADWKVFENKKSSGSQSRRGRGVIPSSLAPPKLMAAFPEVGGFNDETAAARKRKRSTSTSYSHESQ